MKTARWMMAFGVASVLAAGCSKPAAPEPAVRSSDPTPAAATTVSGPGPSSTSGGGGGGGTSSYYPSGNSGTIVMPRPGGGPAVYLPTPTLTPSLPSIPSAPQVTPITPAPLAAPSAEPARIN